MSGQKTAILAVGNAIVDVLAEVDDAFIAQHGMAKGHMTLIDAARAEAIYGAMPAQKTRMSGGSAANTAAGIAVLGGSVSFVGRVRNDELGDAFSHDIRKIGVGFDTKAATDGPATARCLILVTPDAQRTMNTYLGACAEMTPDDVSAAAVADAKVTYLEGYLWDQPRAKEAMRKAMRLAHEAGNKVALTLSDAFCVERHRAEFQYLVEHAVDILFANESEIVSLYQSSDFDGALQHVRHHVDVAALTRSEKGSVILAGETVHIIDAVKGVSVKDTTGAGDLYAAGFLHGYTAGLDLHASGRLGSLCAAEVISHVGARPLIDLKPFVQQARSS
ncbi:adenosine kinase [Ferrovibrio sp.]|uniref:adenosine kinase n=1 Tax=Ferrovibrio sp. TaxID=1917215 RepID=UPI003D274873